MTNAATAHRQRHTNRLRTTEQTVSDSVRGLPVPDISIQLKEASQNALPHAISRTAASAGTHITSHSAARIEIRNMLACAANAESDTRVDMDEARLSGSIARGREFVRQCQSELLLSFLNRRALWQCLRDECRQWLLSPQVPICTQGQR